MNHGVCVHPRACGPAGWGRLGQLSPDSRIPRTVPGVCKVLVSWDGHSVYTPGVYTLGVYAPGIYTLGAFPPGPYPPGPYPLGAYVPGVYVLVRKYCR